MKVQGELRKSINRALALSKQVKELNAELDGYKTQVKEEADKYLKTENKVTFSTGTAKADVQIYLKQAVIMEKVFVLVGDVLSEQLSFIGLTVDKEKITQALQLSSMGILLSCGTTALKTYAKAFRFSDDYLQSFLVYQESEVRCSFKPE